MERYVGRRVHPVAHRRIDEAIAHLPAPAWQDPGHGDLADVAHAVAVVAVGAALALLGAGIADVIETSLLAHLH